MHCSERTPCIGELVTECTSQRSPGTSQRPSQSAIFLSNVLPFKFPTNFRPCQGPRRKAPSCFGTQNTHSHFAIFTKPPVFWWKTGSDHGSFVYPQVLRPRRPATEKKPRNPENWRKIGKKKETLEKKQAKE